MSSVQNLKVNGDAKIAGDSTISEDAKVCGSY